MDRHDQARLRLATERHPASRVVGSLHLAEYHLGETVQGFLAVMEQAGDPGVQPLPRPGGRARWPRGHAARHASGWPVPVAVDDPFQCWLDTTGRWWLVRFDPSGTAADAHTVGSPLHTAVQLGEFRDALDQVLQACGVAH
jgi:hypothetical protein